MRNYNITRLLPATGALSLLLLCIGCSTTQVVHRPDVDSGKEIDVTSWGTTYHFVDWKINEAGDISGTACAKEPSDTAVPHCMTISRQDITSFQVSKFSPEKTARLVGGVAVVGATYFVIREIVVVLKFRMPMSFFHFGISW